MKRSILIIAFSVLSSFTHAEANIVQHVQTLESSYAEYIQNNQFEEALKIAFKLNQVDPADTNALLYIVYSSVELDKPVPPWVLNEPWPNATPNDIINRRIAESLIDQ